MPGFFKYKVDHIHSGGLALGGSSSARSAVDQPLVFVLVICSRTIANQLQTGHCQCALASPEKRVRLL